MERISAVADTGFVVALLNRLDTMHRGVTTIYSSQTSAILLPQTVLTEVAERFGRTKRLTLDQRDFRLFRPRHCESFEIIP